MRPKNNSRGATVTMLKSGKKPIDKTTKTPSRKETDQSASLKKTQPVNGLILIFLHTGLSTLVHIF